MADDDFQDELVKRNSQIADLREELWGARDRVDAAEERAAQLMQGIQSSQGELGIRRAKANGLEDEVSIKQAQGEEKARSIKTIAVSHAAEVARVQHELHSLDQAKSDAEAEIEQERSRQEQMHVQLASLRAKIDAVRQDTERERFELEREDVDLQERLAKSKKEAAKVKRELAEMRQENMMHIQTLQGGLEETRRMLLNHPSPSQQTNEDLVTAQRDLLETRRREREEAVARRLLDAERTAKSQELVAMQRDLLESRRREREAADVARQVLLQAEDAERAARSQEVFLRSKLEEVWQTLRQYA